MTIARVRAAALVGAVFSVTFASQVAAGPSGPTAPSGGEPRGKAIVPESASEGTRDLAPVAAALKKSIAGQPWGRRWKDMAHTGPAPKDTTGTGQAETHPDLQNDPIELQEQARYLEETGVEVRYGLISLRTIRVFAYGRLRGVQIVLDRIGRDEAMTARFDQDMDVIRAAWREPLAALGLGARYQVVQNDLIRPGAELPFRLEIAPVPPRSKT